MVEAQQNIMCQDSGNSPALATCYQPAVAEIRVKTSKDSMGTDILVCKKHFMHPSYPVLKVISCSVTIEKPELPKVLVVVSDTEDGWKIRRTYTGIATLPPGSYNMRRIGHVVDTELQEIRETYRVLKLDEGEGV